MDEEYVDIEAVNALRKYISKAKKEIKKMKPYELQFLEQYLDQAGFPG